MKLGSKLAYTAVAVAAIAVGVVMWSGSDNAAQKPAIALPELTGDLQKLTATTPPIAASDVAFTAPDGSPVRLSDLQGKPVVLNFWATWCAPCRKEMPSLSRLAEQLGDDAQVVTVASGPGNDEAIDRFLAEIGVTNLPKYRDKDQSLTRAMGVLGLPVTVLISSDGFEVARLIGDAEWDDPQVAAVLQLID